MRRTGLTDPEIEILEDLDFRTEIIEPELLRLPVADSVRRFADRTGSSVDSAMFRWHRRWSRYARVGNIRAQSRLRVHAWTPLPDLIERLGGQPLRVSDRNRLLLRSDRPLEPWRRGAYRTEAVLSLRWSWPALPVWVVAEPWWREHTVLTLSLRSTRRWRYPRRYWDGAHRALRGVVIGDDRSGP